MAISQRFWVGFILFTLLSSGVVYLQFQEDVRIRVDDDKTTFYTKNDNSRWVVSGREYNGLFDGTSKMNRRSSEIVVNYSLGDLIIITRDTPYIRGPLIRDTYTFDGSISDVELFPISHQVEIFNASGFFYRYEVRDLVYEGITESLDITEMSFERQMKVKWQDNFRWARVFKSGILKVQYDIPSDYEIYNVKLFDPPIEDQEIGYKFINDTVHIWNNKYDYFFNKSSGIQFTNHYDDYWTKNIFCIGYYDNGEWNKIKCSDELSNFNRDIHSDNLTYVNATLWKDISYGSYDLRLGVGYNLEINDSNLSITLYGKNIGIDIPFDLGFAWKIEDVEIPGLGEDYIDINGSSYALGNSYNLTFENMNESYINIHDVTKFLRLDWDKNLDDTVKIYSDGTQANFYSMLLINAGHFNPGQEKQTTLQWIDADTEVDNAVATTSERRNGLMGPYWVNGSAAVIIFIDDGNDISFSKTIDGGINWVKTQIQAGTTEHITAWFDQETHKDSGDLVHVGWIDNVDDEAKYVTVNISDGSLGTIRIVDSTITSAVTSGNRIALTKTFGGNLLLAFSTQTEIESYRSVDLGVNWVSRADPFETTTEEDWLLLYPANTHSISNDSAGIFWDRSANEISIKMYNDSANTWTETSISGSMSDDINTINMDGSIRHSDRHLLFTAHSIAATFSDDLRTWDLTIDSIASPTVTAKTDIYTDQDESAQVGIVINQQNNDVYISYLKGGNWQSLVDVVFHKSTNGMTSWGSEQAYSETTDDERLVTGGRTIGTFGGRIQWSWYNVDLADIYVNLVNDIEISVEGEDTCTYTSGDWNIDASDNCVISENIVIDGSNVLCTGSGTFTIQDTFTVSNFGRRQFSKGCYYQSFGSGGFFQ